MQSLPVSALSASLLLLMASVSACGGSSQASTSNGGSTTTGNGGDGGTATQTNTETLSGGAGGSGATGGVGGTGGAGATGGTGGTGGATTGGGGTGGMGGGWPTCDAKPDNVPDKALHDIWAQNPAAPTEVWVSGAFVTAVSRSGCTAGTACQFFLQEAPQFVDFAGAAHRSLKVFASASTAFHFEGIAVGDQVDVQAWAWRYNVDGQNELLLQVNQQLPGCAKKVGSAVPVPVSAVLADLTVQGYEVDYGPVFVKLDLVSGKPHLPAQTFGLWTTGQIDNNPDGITSLSPFFLTGAVFTGLTAEKIHDFTSIVGVFGLFVPPANPVVKYKEIYPRDMAEVVIKKVQP